MDAGNAPIISIFGEVLDCRSDDERAAYLGRVCGNDAVLRAKVEALLAAHQRAGNFLQADAPRSGLAATSHLPIPEQAGTVIGPYKLLEQIGEGGMGVVYMADQQEPLRRRVALKIIKPGMDTRQVIARFEAERQALALMDHPNIARVLDAGSTDSGRPYFVMELVRGIPITEYCDQNSLSVHERLELFVQVCHAVQHAHQKGIIHRDIKPSNVLVTLHDGRPVPKVIDFGVAKATNQQLTERTLFTNFAQMVGTPLYMSPEQAEMTGLDVDTRSDIYSLGVLLYELLTGTTPFDKKRIREAAYDEVRRIIREEEPQRPSTRISTLGETRTSIAGHRKIDPDRLSQLVRGDLDWIVMKSLEKDRTHRYETANGLARDVQLYLADQPVNACPPSAMYRFHKFARRNRMALTTAVLISAVLVLGTVVSILQAVRATRAETVAETLRAAEADQRKIAERERTEAEKQREQSEANFQKARKAVDQYFTLVSESQLLEVRALQPVRKELLESALNFYKEFAQVRTNDPAVLADLAVTFLRVAEVYISNDRVEDAVTAITQAVDIIDRLRRDYPGAHEQHRRLAGFWKRLYRVAPHIKAPQDIEGIRRTLEHLADCYQEFADENPGEIAFQSDLAGVESLLGGLLRLADRPSEAVPHYRRAHLLLDRLARDYPATPQYSWDLARVCRYLAAVLPSIGHQEEAEAMLRQSVALQKQLARLPPDRRARSLEEERMLIDLAVEEHDYPEAVRLFRESLRIRSDGDYEFRAAPLFVEINDLAGYEEYRRQLLSRYSDTKDPALAERTVKACSILPLAADDLIKVDKLARRAVELAVQADDNWLLPFAHTMRGLVAYRHGEFDAAIDWCGPKRVQRGEMWFRDVQADLVVAMAYQRLGRPLEANQALAAAERVLGEQSHDSGNGRKFTWHDLMICRALELEAVALINSGPPVEANIAPQKANYSDGVDSKPR